MPFSCSAFSCAYCSKPSGSVLNLTITITLIRVSSGGWASILAASQAGGQAAGRWEVLRYAGGMRGEEIEGSDFPSSRRGYDRAAFDAHLRQVAEGAERRERETAGAGTLAEAAGEKVTGIIAAAEEKAAEIERDARARAEEVLARAEQEARAKVAEARQAVEGLVGKADELRRQVGALGQSLGGAEGQPGPAAETEPGPVVVP